MGNDSRSSSVDGHGETMEEELLLGVGESSLLTERRFSITAIGDLVD